MFKDRLLQERKFDFVLDVEFVEYIGKLYKI